MTGAGFRVEPGMTGGDGLPWFEYETRNDGVGRSQTQVNCEKKHWDPKGSFLG